MSRPLHDPCESPASRLWRDEAYLRQEFSRIRAAALLPDPPGGTCRLETLLAAEVANGRAPPAARGDIAASEAALPITSEMAWALPQLLKRIQLVSPGVLSTSGALRALVRMPNRDEDFAKAFTDSGFLSCDRALERVRWKYDLREMMTRQHGASAWDVLEHARQLLAQHRTKQPVDWNVTLAELQTLVSWFPELRTIRLLREVYARLQVLHMKSILVVQCWLEGRGGTAAGAAPALAGGSVPPAPRAAAHDVCRCI
jgi:hypothetical protein